MRVIDCETHPLLPAGAAAIYERDGGPPRDPKALDETAFAAAGRGEFEDFAADLIRQMDEDGVERSLVMRGTFPARNADLARLVRAHPDRLTAFGAWDTERPSGPTFRETKQAVEALDRGLAMGEIRGVGEISLERRFFPGLTKEEAAAQFAPTFELCRKHRKPVMFHTGGTGSPDAYAYRDPVNLEPLVSAFPEVTVFVAHLGGKDEHYLECSLELAKRRSNVYLTASDTQSSFVERAVAALGPERIVFGSDWSPYMRIVARGEGTTPQRHGIDVVRRARIDERAKELILGENLAGLLGI